MISFSFLFYVEIYRKTGSRIRPNKYYYKIRKMVEIKLKTKLKKVAQFLLSLPEPSRQLGSFSINSVAGSINQ